MHDALETWPATRVFEDRLLELMRLPPAEAGAILAQLDETEAVRLLVALNPAIVRAVLEELPPEPRQRLLAHSPAEFRGQWAVNATYPETSIGALMRPPVGAYPATLAVGDAIAALRKLVAHHFITYLYALDREGRLQGVVVLRDLFLAAPGQTLAEVMVSPAFHLTPDLPLLDAMRLVVNRHYPVYPVCDDTGRLIGLVRGQALFEKQAIVISAQAGRMVGVRSNEGLSTRWTRSLRFRSPWLLFNLLLSLLSALVVTYYRDAVRSMVLLAVFLPVIAAQARSAGSQTMAITLRGLTNGEWTDRHFWPILRKETLLGVITGALVGIVAGALVTLQAITQNQPAPLGTGVVLAVAMLVGCGLSGTVGVLVPLVLRRFGADPALASSIILTTIASVLSQALFLGLAAWWLL